MVSHLRNLPSVDALFGSELGEPRPAEVAELLNLFWPDCCENEQGMVLMHPADAEKMERMFELFGVPMRIAENSLAVIGRAYDVFILGLEPAVTRRLRRPERFHSFYESWAPEWRAYIEAVATQDTNAARALAQKLQPLAPECKFPPGVLVDGDVQDYPRDPARDFTKRKAPSLRRGLRKNARTRP